LVAHYASNFTGSALHVIKSTGTPMKTLAQATQCLKPGDVLYLRGGTYSEEMVSVPSGTPGNPVTLAAYPGETVIIDGSRVFNTGVLPEDALEYVIFDGCVYDGANHHDDSLVGVNNGTNHVQFSNCEIKNAYGNGVGFWRGADGSSSDNNIVYNCNIHNNGRVVFQTWI
jgi:hypothetical protein